MRSWIEPERLQTGARTLAATVVVAPSLAALLWLSGAVPLAVAVGAMMLFVFVVMLAGVLLLRAAHAGDMPAAAAWVLGIFATAMAVYALVGWFQFPAAAAFGVWMLFVLGSSIVYKQRAPSRLRLDAKELAGLLLCGATTLMWCWDTAEAPHILAREGRLHAWIDFFIHGGVISQIGDPLALGRGSIDLADFQAPLYHYASYVLPAVFAGPLDLPGLPLSTSVWLPLGFLTMCAGAYALGAALAGPAGGVAAVAALTLLPDAASYGLRNGAFGYHWSILGGPGSSYAVGFCLLSIALLERWSREGKPLRPLLVGAFLVGGTALVRVHVFALAFPALLASAAMTTPWVQRNKLASFSIAITAFALFVAGFYATVPYAVPALELSLDVVHSLFEPTAYTGWYRRLLESYGPGAAVPVGLLLVYVASLGALIVLYPLSVWLRHRSRGLDAIDLVPGAFLACYLLLMIAAPVSRHGDPTELTQRPFVILYAVVAVWTAAGFVNWIAAQSDWAAQRAWLALLLFSGLALPVLWPHTGVLGKLPRFAWGWEHSTHSVEEGLTQAADFLRARSRPGDIFAAQVKLDGTATDIATELASLTGMPAYLGRPFIHLGRGGRREHVVRERYAALKRIAAEDDAAAAARRLRQLGIQWYVVVGSEGPRWDRDRQRAAYAGGKVAVYAGRRP